MRGVRIDSDGNFIIFFMVLSSLCTLLTFTDFSLSDCLCSKQMMLYTVQMHVNMLMFNVNLNGKVLCSLEFSTNVNDTTKNY